MKLTREGIADRKVWLEHGYHLPQYDIDAMVEKTKKEPFWIHFGAGNLFRAFHVRIVSEMLDQGMLDRGLIVAEGFDYELIDRMYRPHNNLGIVVTLKSDGTMEKDVVASVAEAIPLDSDNEVAFARLREIFMKDSLQMATFTITEKGYMLRDASGQYHRDVLQDFKRGPAGAGSYIGKVVSLLYARFLAGKKPIALISTDNCSHNGDRLYKAIAEYAYRWKENGVADARFVDYIESDAVSFPWSMIDKITPRPDEGVEALLKQDGVEDVEPILTAKKTYVAPFVNAEETQYLVIEDDFPNGHETLQADGLFLTDRKTVDIVEKMKVCICLNPLHTCLAIFGCLLGCDRISEEMKDPELKHMIEIIGYEEGLPVVTDPEILDPTEFLRTVLEVRLPNPFMPDTPQRIATDTSQKLAIRFGETIKAYMRTPGLEASSLRMIPLVLAGWIRYLMAIDDEGKPFTLSADPMLPLLCPLVEGITWADDRAAERIRPILEDTQIFGVNLEKAGLAEKVCGCFTEMIKGPGAVRATLKKYGTEV